MKKIALLFITIVSIGYSYSAKGMVTYKKLCYSCHGPAFKGAAMMESHEWRSLFANKATGLKALHENSQKAIERLNSSYFNRRAQALENFLINNARDKGIVRGCDGLNCG